VKTPRTLGRYALHDALASGGMATVHLGRLLGPAGFSRTVAIKRLHENFARDPEFVSMFLDEARLAARIRHPNVVATLDVVASAGELFLVMDYVEGESLGRLMLTTWARNEGLPPRIASAIMSSVLAGLHAAHEAVSEDRSPLGIIHRDVSPQNILVGIDGVPRVVDFGVAKAAGRIHTTRDGQLKGKLSYMPPEQIRGEKVDRRVDVYAASIVLWEALAGRKLFQGEDAQVMFQVLEPNVEPPSKFAPVVSAALDAVVLKGLSSSPEARYETALEMAAAIENAEPPASTRELAEWVALTAGDALESRAAMLAEVEKSTHKIRPADGPSSRSLLESEPTTQPLRWSERRPHGRGRMPWLYLGAALAGGLAAAAYALLPRGGEPQAPSTSATTGTDAEPPSELDEVGTAAPVATVMTAPNASADAPSAPTVVAPNPVITGKNRGFPPTSTATAVPSSAPRNTDGAGTPAADAEPDYGF